MQSNYKKAAINVIPADYEDFKIVCKLAQSDSNKEIRKFIRRYNKKHERALKIYKDQSKPFT